MGDIETRPGRSPSPSSPGTFYLCGPLDATFIHEVTGKFVQFAARTRMYYLVKHQREA